MARQFTFQLETFNLHDHNNYYKICYNVEVET